MLYTCEYVYIYIHKYVFKYTYIEVHTYTYIYIHLNACIETEKSIKVYTSFTSGFPQELGCIK